MFYGLCWTPAKKITAVTLTNTAAPKVQTLETFSGYLILVGRLTLKLPLKNSPTSWYTLELNGSECVFIVPFQFDLCKMNDCCKQKGSCTLTKRLRQCRFPEVWETVRGGVKWGMGGLQRGSVLVYLNTPYGGIINTAWTLGSCISSDTTSPTIFILFYFQELLKNTFR